MSATKLTNIFRKDAITQVGRWCVPNSLNSKQKSILISDRANEDHCGGCGNGLLADSKDIAYFITTIDQKAFTQRIFEENEKYYFPFIF